MHLRLKSLIRKSIAGRLNHGHPVEKTRSLCMNCGAREALLLRTPLAPDFDITLLSAQLQRPFKESSDGFCFVCGFYQQYARYSPEELRKYWVEVASKDETIGEEAFHSYPVPVEYVRTFETQHFLRRIDRWEALFDEMDVQAPRKVLFLRPMFGATAAFVDRRFRPELHGMEISEVCRRTVLDRVPNFNFPNGQIHGMFEGEFLEAKYDAVFSYHTLIHCIDIRQSIRAIARSIADGGFAIFSGEVQRKPWNPFHVSYPSEPQFVNLLRDYFGSVVRIDDCDLDPPEFITRFTIRGDSPDFFVQQPLSSAQAP